MTGGAGYLGTVLVDHLAGAGRRRPRPRPERAGATRRRGKASRSRSSSATSATATTVARGVRRRRRRRAQRRPGPAGQGPAPVPLGQRRRDRGAAPRRARRRRRPRSCTCRRRRSSASRRRTPCTEDTPPRPLEAYGPGEGRGRGAVPRGDRRRARRQHRPAPHDPRPRAARHHRRSCSSSSPRARRCTCSTAAANRYQFVHADDLADACLRALDRAGPGTYNIGAAEFGTMRETLQALVDHAGTGSRVRSLPSAPARLGHEGALDGRRRRRSRRTTGCCTASRCGSTRPEPRTSSGGRPTRSNAAMVIESYEWFLAHRDELGGGSAPPVAGRARGSRHPEAARLMALDAWSAPRPLGEAAGAARRARVSPRAAGWLVAVLAGGAGPADRSSAPSPCAARRGRRCSTWP